VVARTATTGLVGLGLPEVCLKVVLALLAAASLITVIQRMVIVRRQALASRDVAAGGVSTGG
jgi:CDP-diacylglycerol---glycerol-3-phosphate 3-phosphatidyltransferase